MPKTRTPQYYMDAYVDGEGFSFNSAAFDDAIDSQGVTLFHYRAMPCPLGMIDKNDQVNRVHPPHQGCSNGILFRRMGKVRALFVGNAAQEQQQDLGLLDGSTVNVTLPRFYTEFCPEDGQLPGKEQERIYVAPFDRFHLFEDESPIFWETTELVEYSLSGVDRLRYKAEQVEQLVDNLLRTYQQGRDFELENGKIVWTGKNRPGSDTETNDGRGRVYSIWYKYRPWWYVSRIVHQGRLCQVQDPVTGERKVERMPMEVQFDRETLNQNSTGSGPAGTDPRENRPPRDGSLSP